MRFVYRDHRYITSAKITRWVGSKNDIQYYCIYVHICTDRLGQKSSKNEMTYYMDGPNLIVHSAKYIQGFTYVAYGRGRVAEDNKGWTIMIIDQGPNVWASIGQRPLGYNVFARMSVALKKNREKKLEKIVKLLRSIARCIDFPNFL